MHRCYKTVLTIRMRNCHKENVAFFSFSCGVKFSNVGTKQGTILENLSVVDFSFKATFYTYFLRLTLWWKTVIKLLFSAKFKQICYFKMFKPHTEKGIMHSCDSKCLNRWIYKCNTNIPFSGMIVISELDFRSWNHQFSWSNGLKLSLSLSDKEGGALKWHSVYSYNHISRVPPTKKTSFNIFPSINARTASPF